MILLLALKVALVVSVGGVLVFVADYCRLTRGACWRDAVGVTIIVKDVFIAGTLAPLLLAAFFHLSPLGNEIGSWALIGFLFAAGVAMFWRVLVFEQIYRRGVKARKAAETPGEEATLITCWDTIENGQFPPGGQAYAAYVDGEIGDQPNYAWIVKAFPSAHHMSIALFADHDADCLDMEPGAASPSDFPGWYARQVKRGIARPVIYANAFTMQTSVLAALSSAGIARSSVRLWTAHYGPASISAARGSLRGAQHRRRRHAVEQQRARPGARPVPAPRQLLRRTASARTQDDGGPRAAAPHTQAGRHRAGRAEGPGAARRGRARPRHERAAQGRHRRHLRGRRPQRRSAHYKRRCTSPRTASPARRRPGPHCSASRNKKRTRRWHLTPRRRSRSAAP